MCRSDRRCPNCGGNTAAERRNSARIRKQRSVAGQALRAALGEGSTTAARAAEQKLRAIEGGNAAADRILADLSQAQPKEPAMAVEAREPALTVTATEPAPSTTATKPDPAPEEVTQTKTGSPARIDAWLSDLQRQGYTILSTSEEQAGRNLRVTVRFRKTEPPPAPLTTSAEPASATNPAPAPKLTPITGETSIRPLIENTWGALGSNSRVHFHDDGPIGDALRVLGPDARMNVDGEPLTNVLGVIATEVVRGERTTQQAIDELTMLRDRLPQTSRARAVLARTIDKVDAPVTPVPPVPDGTPEPLRQLVHALHAVPMVRSDPSKEMEPLLEFINDLAAGRARLSRRNRDIGRLIRNKRHESFGDIGKFEIDRAVEAAVKALDEQQQ